VADTTKDTISDRVKNAYIKTLILRLAMILVGVFFVQFFIYKAKAEVYFGLEIYNALLVAEAMVYVFLAASFVVAFIEARFIFKPTLDLANRNYKKLKAKEQEMRNHTESLLEVYQRLTDDLVYAKTVQEYILPKEETIKKAIGECFIIYRPKDLVGGDFYWCDEAHNLKYMIVGDCVGHGVSGALLSMLGIELVTAAIDHRQLADPADILADMDERLRLFLNKNIESQGETMDVSVFAMDTVNKTAMFAGAGQSMLYIKNGKIFKTGKSRRSVGSLLTQEHFQYTSEKIDLEGVTHIFLFSDGFKDQLDAENKRIMGSKAFKELLLSQSTHPMEEQKENLVDTYNEWRGSTERVDDVTLIGIKLDL
jgi:serine phosphatase RsbU (regulator of sigma subunit)